MSISAKLGYVFIAPALILVVLFFLSPVILTGVFSFTNMSTATGITGGAYKLTTTVIRDLSEKGISKNTLKTIGSENYSISVDNLNSIKDKNIIKNEIRLLKEKKEQAQPTKIKTSGSTFKNPVDQSDKKVWQLIKESVPLEKSFGDASISEKHCNFFVNKGNAKFEDMKKLINFVSDSVFKKTGIKLETEIKILE